ncbi:MAG: hypothetical protein JWQ96_3313 [Segetibacter sp.]|nr:hypothetical protein [Segetibacter sp.]
MVLFLKDKERKTTEVYYSLEYLGINLGKHFYNVAAKSKINTWIISK